MTYKYIFCKFDRSSGNSSNYQPFETDPNEKDLIKTFTAGYCRDELYCDLSDENIWLEKISKENILNDGKTDYLDDVSVILCEINKITNKAEIFGIYKRCRAYKEAYNLVGIDNIDKCFNLVAFKNDCILLEEEEKQLMPDISLISFKSSDIMYPDDIRNLNDEIKVVDVLDAFKNVEDCRFKRKLIKAIHPFIEEEEEFVELGLLAYSNDVYNNFKDITGTIRYFADESENFKSYITRYFENGEFGRKNGIYKHSDLYKESKSNNSTLSKQTFSDNIAYPSSKNFVVFIGMKLMLTFEEIIQIMHVAGFHLNDNNLGDYITIYYFKERNYDFNDYKETIKTLNYKENFKERLK